MNRGRNWKLLFVPLLIVATIATSLSGIASTIKPAYAISNGVVISQVYGSGGTNASSTYYNDFVELFNRGTSNVSLNGLSIQYASATGTSWAPFALPATTLAPGQYFLIKAGPASTTGLAALPTPDASTNANLATAAGKLALVNGTTALTCGASCANNASVIDFIGYGTTANNYEGTAAAPAPGNTTADVRAAAGCTDTDQNGTDFTAATPNPRNTSSALNPCVSATSTPTNTATATNTATNTSTATNTATDTATSTATDTATAIDTATSTATDTAVATNTPSNTATATATNTAGAATVDHLVISQVYGGGGNTGATYKNDFIELFNPTTATVSVNGWSVQYGAATGTTFGSSNMTTLSGSIAPGQYFLIQEAAGTGGTTNLPTPDVTGTVALGGSAGKVALVNNSTTLTCGASCVGAAGVVDFVGFGATANNYEGAGPAPAPSATLADLRNGGGCVDTNDNAADFTAVAPTPRNTASALNPCSGGATATATNTPGGATNTPTLTPTATNTVVAGTTRIHDIQGSGLTSPLNGQTVSNVPGIVTAKESSGFFVQDPNADSNDATSEGVLVYGSQSTAQVAVGDSILFSGTVTEYTATGCDDSLSVTEINYPTVTIISHSNPLPAPIILGTGGRIPPTQSIPDGINFYESMEGMLVQANNPVATGPTKTFSGNHEIPVLGDNAANATHVTVHSSVYVTATGYTYGPTDSDFNPERIILNDLIVGVTDLPNVNVGDHFTTAATGVMDYTFCNYKVQITAPLTRVADGVQREVSTAAGSNQLSVGSFNVENLAPSDPQTKFNNLASLIINNLKSPDVINLEEIQDNTGATDDGTVAADQTLAKLIAAITAAGGPSYQYREIDPVNDQDGGQPGGNIRVVFLYRTDRGLSFVDRAGGTSTSAVTVNNVGGEPQLSFSPGRIDPTNSAWSASRKPLVGEFYFNGQHLFLIDIHFNSKGGDSPLFGSVQPPTRSSETQRHQQAQVVNNFVDSILGIDPGAKIVISGDVNDYQFSETMSILKGGNAPVLNDLIQTLPENEQFSYNYDGNAQVLDHIITSNSMLNALALYDVVHVNSEFYDQASDHDPEVALFNLAPAATATATVSPTGTVATSTATSTSTQTATATNTAVATATTVPGSHLVISQVYGAGGNSGATYNSDFIEVFNPTGATISVAGYSVQYASATGTAYQVTNLSGSIAPGHYYLVQEAGGANGAALPTADATGTIAMGSAAGKVALVSSTTALTCGSSCVNAAGVVDYVGFGTTANQYEGTGPAPAPSVTLSDIRAGGGCVDTNNNAADFAAAAVNPRNSATAANLCASSTATSTATNTAVATDTATASSTATETVTATSTATNTAVATATGTATNTATASATNTVAVTNTAIASATASGTSTTVPQTCAPVSFVNAVNVTVSGNSITKNSSALGYNAGASSSQQITSGNGSVSATVVQTNTYLMFGLSNVDSDTNYTSIKYALYTNAANRTVGVYESGVFRGYFGAYTNGDVLKVAVDNGVVTYYRNATLLYTSTVAVTYPLVVDSSIYSPGGTLSNVTLCAQNSAAAPSWTPTGTATSTRTPTATATVTNTPLPALSCQNVVWTNAVNVTVSGNTITKSSSANGYNAGASSTVAIQSGRGSVQATVQDNASYLMFGLSNSDPNTSYTSIKYAIYTNAANNTVGVWESGVSRGTFGFYTVGDVLRVEVNNGVVSYYRNATLLYTSSVAATYPLIMDSAIYTPGGQVANAMICGANLAVAPVSVQSNDPAPLTAPASFSDVPAGSAYIDYVSYLSSRGIVSGYADGSFHVNASLTRGQLAKLIALADSSNTAIDPSQQTFSDVPYGSPFWIYVEGLSNDHIIGGYADGTFRPGATATRGQVAMIIARALKLNTAIPAGQQTFTDVPSSSPYFAAVERLASKGIISGNSVNGSLVFRPTDNLTRGQVAKIMTLGFFPDYKGQ